MTTADMLSTRGRGWAYTGAILGGLISIAANVAHSFVAPTGAAANWAPQPGAVVGSMFWPILLFVAVEILARVKWPKGFWWGVLRFGGMLPVAAVAALVSYRHLRALLLFYGEDTTVAFLGPLAVDGLMVMATAALLATSMGKAANKATASTSTFAMAPAFGHATHRPAETNSDRPPVIPPVIGRDTAPVTVPGHLLSTARFAVNNHRNTQGQAMTADELAAAMNISPALAGNVLNTLHQNEHGEDDQPMAMVAPVLNGQSLYGGEAR